MSFKESKDGGFGPMTDGPLGAIELGFFKKGDSINICICQARGLKSFDSNGYSDPYIKFQILPDAKPSTKRKTRIIRKNLNPVWNETFEFKIPPKVLHTRRISLSCWDYDLIGANDYMGGITIPLVDIVWDQKVWFVLIDEEAVVRATKNGAQATTKELAALQRRKSISKGAGMQEIKIPDDGADQPVGGEYHGGVSGGVKPLDTTRTTPHGPSGSTAPPPWMKYYVTAEEKLKNQDPNKKPKKKKVAVKWAEDVAPPAVDIWVGAGDSGAKYARSVDEMPDWTPRLHKVGPIGTLTRSHPKIKQNLDNQYAAAVAEQDKQAAMVARTQGVDHTPPAPREIEPFAALQITNSVLRLHLDKMEDLAAKLGKTPIAMALYNTALQRFQASIALVNPKKIFKAIDNLSTSTSTGDELRQIADGPTVEVDEIVRLTHLASSGDHGAMMEVQRRTPQWALDFAALTCAIDISLDTLVAMTGSQTTGGLLKRANAVSDIIFGSSDKISKEAGLHLEFVVKTFKAKKQYPPIRLFAEAIKMVTTTNQFSKQVVPILKKSLGNDLWTKLVEDGI